MQDMKNGYDSLFSAAAATANSAYGNCFILFLFSSFIYFSIFLAYDFKLEEIHCMFH